MPPQSLPALQSGTPTAWEEAVYAFLIEKRARSGSTRTVESYALAVTTVYLRRLEGETDRTWPDVAAAIGLEGSIPATPPPDG